MLRRFARTVAGYVTSMALAIGVLTPTPSAAQTTGLGLSATMFDVVRLAPTAPVATSSIPVSDATTVFFDVVTTAPSVGIVVITPNSVRIPESNIGTIGGTIERVSVPAGGGFLLNPLSSPGEHIFVTIPSPQAGTWRLELSEPAGNTSELAAAITAVMDSPTVTALVALPQVAVRGQAVTLTMAAFAGAQPLTGATVQAEVVAPDGGVSTLTLLDNGTSPDATAGDGLYSVALIPSTIGDFEALATLTGMTPGGTSVVRQATTTFAVVEPTLAILGSVPVRTVDTNGNGLIDEVFLDVSVNVLVAGDFTARATLTASNGATLTRTVRVTLSSTGNTIIPIGFPADDVRSLGVDGPYRIGPVEIIYHAPTGAVPADRIADAGLTPPIALSSLERPTVEYAGTFTDSGIDTNGNGLFDRLQVDLGMRFANAGTYQFSAILFDRNERQIGFSNGTVTVAAGASTMRLTFDGQNIGANGVDGPYTIGNLLVNGPGGSLVLRRVTNTSAFLAQQFEGFSGGGLTGVDLTTSVVSPQPTGTSVVLTATPRGGTAPISYRFWLQSWRTGVWEILQDWSTTATFTWVPSAPGGYNLAVEARSAGATNAEVQSAINYEITAPTAGPLTRVNLITSTPSPQRAGQANILAAEPTGGTPPIEYRFWIRPWTGDWQMVRDWSTNDKFEWTPTVAGGYVLGVEARSGGATAAEVQSLINFEVLAP